MAPGRPSSSPQIASTLGLVRRSARDSGHPGVLLAIEGARSLLAVDAPRVVVAGEYKQGKTALIGALLDTELPTSPTVATAATSLFHHASTTEAVLVDAEHRLPIDADQAAALATQGCSGLIEIGLPHPLLATGVGLIDTPGFGTTGGIDAAIGALALADAVILVTDAGRELTASESWFLTTAAPAVGAIAVAVTRIDMMPDWRRTVARIRDQVAELDLTPAVFATAAPLHHRARTDDDPALDAESGLPALSGWLTGLADRGRDLRDRTVLRTMAAALDDLLAAGSSREAGPTGRWQQMLADGIADLTADLDHQLRTETRAILRDAEARIDAVDPAIEWDDIAVDVQRRVAELIVAIEALLRERVEVLTGDVSSALGVEGHVAMGDGPSTRTVGAARPDLAVGGVASQGLSVLRGSYAGAAMTGMAGQLLGITLLGPAALAVGVALGAKSLRDDRRRTLAQRRVGARTALRSHLDDVHLAASKQARDRLRFVSRSLRDHFSEQAALADRATGTAAPAPDRARLTELRTRVDDLLASIGDEGER